MSTKPGWDVEPLLDAMMRSLAPWRQEAETGMIGIYTGGAWIARRLHAAMGLDLPLGGVDISF